MGQANSGRASMETKGHYERLAGGGEGGGGGLLSYLA